VDPRVQVFGTGGVAFTRFKTDTTHLKTVFDHVTELKKLAEAYNASVTEADKKIDLTVFNKDSAKILKSHSSMRCVPVIGAGVTWEISPGVNLLVEYNYMFRTSIVKSDKAGVDASMEGHKVKLGVLFNLN
jgi:opacity protein-like surface antigen